MTRDTGVGVRIYQLRHTTGGRQCQKVGEKHGTDRPSQRSAGASLASVLILGFQPPEL